MSARSLNNSTNIISIQYNYTGNYRGDSLVAGTQLSSDGTEVISDSTNLNPSWSTIDSYYHKVESISQSGVSRLNIQNVASVNNTQLRLTGISITYLVD